MPFFAPNSCKLSRISILRCFEQSWKKLLIFVQIWSRNFQQKILKNINCNSYWSFDLVKSSSLIVIVVEMQEKLKAWIITRFACTNWGNCNTSRRTTQKINQPSRRLQIIIVNESMYNQLQLEVLQHSYMYQRIV